MDRPSDRLVLAFAFGVLVGIVAGFGAVGAWSNGSGHITDELGENTVWVGGTLQRVDGSTVRVNTTRFAGGPAAVDVVDAALFTCSPAENGVSCDPLDGPAALSTGDTVCVSVRADDGKLVGIKLFANATCSLAPG